VTTADHTVSPREPWFVWAASVAITAAIALSPLPRAYLGAAFAAVFFLLPDFVLKRRGSEIEAYGFSFGGWRRGAVWGVGASLVVLAGFLPGYHLWMTQAQPAIANALGQSSTPNAALDITLGAYSRPEQRLWGQPTDTDGGDLHVYHQHGLVYVAWHTNGPWRLEISSDGELLPNGRLASATDRTWRRDGQTARPVRLSFGVRGADHVRIVATENGEPVPLSSFRLGGAATPAQDDDDAEGGLRFQLGFLWVLNMMLVHLLLVALPEELFFRGYLQRVFDETRGRSVWLRLGPVVLTRSIVITSALFALGHLMVEPSPGRLAVFFPSLLFGALRDKSDGLVAPVILHAACNVMVQLTVVHYWW
jgi:membrane protease YdiL (CAAX protease family)